MRGRESRYRRFAVACDHRVHNVRLFPELPTARWRSRRLAPCSARRRGRRRPLRADAAARRENPRRRSRHGHRAGRRQFVAQTDLDGEHERRASAVLRAMDGWERPAPHDVAALLGRIRASSRGPRFGGGSTTAVFSTARLSPG